MTQEIFALADVGERRLYYRENRFDFPPGPGRYEWVSSAVPTTPSASVGCAL